MTRLNVSERPPTKQLKRSVRVEWSPAAALRHRRPQSPRLDDDPLDAVHKLNRSVSIRDRLRRFASAGIAVRQRIKCAADRAISSDRLEHEPYP
jgi:hypothetical protein